MAQKQNIMEKGNYSFMNILWIVVLTLSCGISKSSTNQKYVDYYQVLSPTLSKIVARTIDSCQSRIRCDKVEFLFLRLEKTSKHLVQVESLRKPLLKLNSIFKKDSSQVIAFHIDETLCLADKKLLISSGILNHYKEFDKISLSSLTFKYNCLDIESNGDVYNTLIRFNYFIKDDEIRLNNHSIFIDSGDADISETLKKRGIKYPSPLMRSYPQSRFDAIFIGKSGIAAVAYHA